MIVIWVIISGAGGICLVALFDMVRSLWAEWANGRADKLHAAQHAAQRDARQKWVGTQVGLGHLNLSKWLGDRQSSYRFPKRMP